MLVGEWGLEGLEAPCERNELEESWDFIFDFPLPRVKTLRKVPLPLGDVGEAGFSSTVSSFG